MDVPQKVTRRRFLQVTALSTTTGVLVACGAPQSTATNAPAAPEPTATTAAAPTTAPTVVATAAAPTESVAATTGAETAVSGTDGPSVIKSSVEGARDAYLKQPEPFQSVSGTPGKGSTIRMAVSVDIPDIPGRESNPYWQELEKRLGVTLEPIFIPADAYQERLGAMAAANDIPDVALIDPTSQAKLIQQGAFADLTPYLAGEKLKDYPNLAGFAPQTWQNSAIGGKFYGVPRPRPLIGAGLHYRHDWTEKLGMDVPKNADELAAMAIAFSKNDPDGNGASDTYGLSRIATGVAYHMFGVPNLWRKESDGSLTYYIETPEFKEAIAWTRKLYEDGAYHPDVLTLGTQDWKDVFNSGKVGGVHDSIASWREYYDAAKELTPDADVRVLPPFGAKGGNGSHWVANGFFQMAAISVQTGQDPARVQEILRVLDYFAAPFGSEEFNFINYGIEGAHHTRNPDGTFEVDYDRFEAEAEALIRIANAPRVLFFPGNPDYATTMQRFEEEQLSVGVTNPALTGFSETQLNMGRELTQFITDEINSIVSGRKPLEAVDDMIAQWKSRGGDRIAEELAQSLQG